MDVNNIQDYLIGFLDELTKLFQQLPGSPILLRYIKSSYQNDPVRSGIELFLCLFAVRYLLAPAYSTHNKSYVPLSEEVRQRNLGHLDLAEIMVGNRRLG